MRKIAMGLALVKVFAAVGAGTAFASDQIIQCRSNPCYGSGNSDLIYERVGNQKHDTIILRGGDGGRDYCVVDSRAELTPSCERVTIQ